MSNTLSHNERRHDIKHTPEHHRPLDTHQHENEGIHENRHSEHRASIREQEEHRAYSKAIENAPTTEEFQNHREERSPAERRGPVTKKELRREFNHTMNNARLEMSPTERTFSKFIHSPVIESTSEFLAATIARPNALLAGSIGAFILTLGFYLFSKSMGYSLSGFEPIAAFITGWIVGLLYDYLRIMVTGKR